jgi:hypothetical protein
MPTEDPSFCHGIPQPILKKSCTKKSSRAGSTKIPKEPCPPTAMGLEKGYGQRKTPCCGKKERFGRGHE